MSQLVIWEIPKSDLVPLLVTYRRDRKLCMCVIKILVALTLPVTRAFNNVQQHLLMLQSCKELFTKGDLLAIVMGFLAEPLSRSADDRTEKDTSVIDLMLHLFHNLLHIRTSTATAVDNTRAALDDALLRAFFQENVMDVVVVLAQSVDREANQKWAMLLCNIFFLLTDGFVPEDLCFAHYSLASAGGAKASVAEAGANLRALRAKEKRVTKQDKFRLSGRHSQFGGSLVATDAVDGSKKILDARQLLVPAQLAPKVKHVPKAAVPWDRVNREASRETKALLFKHMDRVVSDDVFSLLMHEAAQAISRSDLEQELVPSFQADVNRYIRLVAWFVRFDYVRQAQAIRLTENPADVRREHPILEKMPIDEAKQTFTLAHIETVLNPKMATFLFKRAEHMFDQKPVPFRDIHVVFRALAEMLNTCDYILCNGTLDLKYEAKKTLYQIFLDRRLFLDRVPWLLQHVGLRMPKHYVVSLVNLVELTFVALEKIVEIDKGLVVMKKQKRRKYFSLKENKRYEEDEKSESDKEYVEGEENLPPLPAQQQEAAPEPERELERFNDFAELQTQEFGLTDYVRKFQHNKVIEVILPVLDDFEKNTEETNMALWRLFERIRTGAGDALVALPAIFCQARVLCVFSRIFAHCQLMGNAVNPAVKMLEEFATRIIEELMRLTRDGTNAHIFAAMLFWRSLGENRDFEDMNMRLAYEEALERGDKRFVGGMDGDDDDDGEDGEWKAKHNVVEAVLEDEEVLLDPEEIARSKKADEERRAAAKRLKRTRPKLARTAYDFYCLDYAPTLQDEQPDLVGAALLNALTNSWNALAVPDRAKFDAMEAQDKERYESEMRDWTALQQAKQQEAGDDKKKKRLKKRDRDAETPVVAPAVVVPEAELARSDESGSSEDVPLGLVAQGVKPRKLKRVKPVVPAAEDQAVDADGFDAEEDASIRAAYSVLQSRQPEEIPRMLALHASSQKTPRELVLRLGKLGLVSDKALSAMLNTL
jgi:hypothetical protein